MEGRVCMGEGMFEGVNKHATITNEINTNTNINQVSKSKFIVTELVLGLSLIVSSQLMKKWT